MKINQLLNHKFFWNVSVFLAGGLLPLAFAPLSIYILAALCPAWLLYSWLNCDSKTAFWRGLWFGIGYFGVGISWVFISIHRYGNSSALLAGILTLLFVLILALFPAMQGWLLRRIIKKASPKLFIAFPASWVLFEWLRSWIFTGFPWLLLGDSQNTSPLAGYIPIFGEFGVSFLVTLTASFIIFIVTSSRKPLKLIAFLSLIFMWGIGYGLKYVNWTEPYGKPLTVTLVQGNIPQQLKWSAEYLNNILQTYVDLTRPHWQSQLIIWPEGSIPLPKSIAANFIDELQAQSINSDTQLILGIPSEASDPKKYYNSLILLGKNTGEYHKRHLVPFGEYVPFEKWLRGLIGFFDIPMSDFISGPTIQKNLQVNDLKIAPFICYEIAYSELVRTQLPEANVLLVISDDAWFGESFAPAQHLQIAAVRAMQTQRYVMISTNNGITAIVTPEGKVQTSILPFTTTTLTDVINGRANATPWVRWGNTPIILLMAIMLLFCMV